MLKDANSSPAPWLAFGTGSALFGQDAAALVTQAISTGIFHLDGAQMYANEETLGAGINASGKARNELYIVTKLKQNSSIQGIKPSLRDSLKKLGTDYVDLFLVHSPYGHNSRGTLPAVWKEMEAIKAEGLARSIGVSNYRVDDLKATLETAKIVPAVNQIELHPYVWKAAEPIVKFCKEHGIVVASYAGQSPIARLPGGPLDGILESIRKRLETTRGQPVTSGQVLTQWLRSKGVIVVTTSSKESRIKEFIDTVNVPDLTAEHIREIEEAGSKIHKRFFMHHLLSLKPGLVAWVLSSKFIMWAFRLLGLSAAVGFTLAQNTTTQTAHCIQSSEFTWMSNSLGQDPCTVAQYLGGACNGEFKIPPLATNQVYIGPTPNGATECRCSSVFYSLLSACAICQRGGTILWDTYDGNCSAIYVVVFPVGIPTGTAVPHWAYMNVTIFGGFNATYAQQLSNSPESTTGPQSTGTTSPSNQPSHKSSSIVGPAVGGAVGGLVFLTLLGAGVLLLWQRRRRSPAPQQAAVLHTGQSLPEGKSPVSYQSHPMPENAPLLYDPSDPRTFPPTPTPFPMHVNPTPTGQKSTITGSSSNAMPSREYTGAPEL
ncbi:hypothetical protein APHAL10511_001058 [Amanita phalloides]|nr:hypothetical protein APHAL10511_001058 [Amanita phalloides]